MARYGFYQATQHISSAGRNDTGYFALLADVDADLGQMDEATKLYQKEISQNPDRDEAYLSLALVFVRSGRSSDARTHSSAVWSASRTPASFSGASVFCPQPKAMLGAPKST